MMMKKAIVLLAIGAVSAVQADVVNLAFTVGYGANPNSVMDGIAYSGANAPAAYTGTNWNEYSYLGAYNNLQNSDGIATGINVSLTGTGGAIWSYNAAVPDNALDTYMYNGTGRTIDISGATGAYDLYILSQDSNPTVIGSFTLGAATKSTIAVSPSTYVDGENYVKFANVPMTGGVSVTINSGTFNGLQLVAIPEPATLGLVAVFGGGVLFIRRRFMI